MKFFMNKFFENLVNARIWVTNDLKCKIYNTDEIIEIKQYLRGKIFNEYNKKMIVALMENGKKVLIDKKFILINLPDVMQKQVQYEITNAKSSIYNIHGNEIPNVTRKKLYTEMGEDIKVPLMLNTAIKLFSAEDTALKQGFTLKIYDTYRPYSVTKYLYQNTLLVADKFKEYFNATVNNFEYSQKWFLAENASSHNYGVALDLTLVDLKTGKELEMQTKIHDLSVYSVVDYNNKEAKILAKIMTKNGFIPLRSEWWHFQDNDSKERVLDFQVK